MLPLSTLHSTMFSINHRSADHQCGWRFPLHSTMFSINHFSKMSISCRDRLYIPLCFLLIPSHVLIWGYIEVLYIPLCFLLISTAAGVTVARELLYIPLCFLLIAWRRDPLPGRCDPLHSTMFSINQAQHCGIDCCDFLYIPLCFLLILSAKKHKD